MKKDKQENQAHPETPEAASRSKLAGDQSASDSEKRTKNSPKEGFSGHFAQLLGNAHFLENAKFLDKLNVSSSQRAQWIGRLWGILMALQKLARTVGRLLFRLKDRFEDHRNLEGGQNGEDFGFISQADWAELQEQFEELWTAFPDAGELFFGLNALDKMVEELFTLEQTGGVFEQLETLAQHIDEQVREFIMRLFERAFDERQPARSMERLDLEQLEGFLRALEALIQEILDRWVLARVFKVPDNFEGQDDLDASEDKAAATKVDNKNAQSEADESNLKTGLNDQDPGNIDLSDKKSE